ncbi:MAG: HPP family protein [Vicinamibacterales bacterium]
MDRDLELHCRDDLRQARATVLDDAEAFPEVLFAIERTGAALVGRAGSLDKYRNSFMELARRTPLADKKVAGGSFGRLYDLVQAGRNDALHQGAYARHLADRAIELAIVLEDALVNGSDLIGDYMVRGAVVAHLWQPLRVVRHQMLSRSFSFLPVRDHDAQWRVVSDAAIARALRSVGNADQRGQCLATTLQDAVRDGGLSLSTPKQVDPDQSVKELMREDLHGLPVLVVDTAGELLGIVTPFDLL